MSKLTLITPTYNRGGCLQSCFESLCAQTCKDFQWIIVDDGSADDTRLIVKGFIEAPHGLSIDYIYKENGGKHTALNAAHPYIKGKYVSVLDSDDMLVPNAVERILDAWKTYEQNSEVGQIIFLKGTSIEEPVCTAVHPGKIVDTLKEPRVGEDGRDCFDVYRTELFIEHPFPEFEGEKFIGEGSAFFFIEKESKGVYYNEVLYLFSYREDGLTKAGRKMRLENPRGGRYNSMVYMDKGIPFKTRIKKGMLCTCYSKLAGISLKQNLQETPYKALMLATYLPGLALKSYWCKKYNPELRTS